MASEWTLSDKIDGNGEDFEEYWTSKQILYAKDVKEFITRLKQAVVDFNFEQTPSFLADTEDFHEMIDKLAGDALI